MEKITVINGAVAVYKFTLPEGASFGVYSKLTAQFLVDEENYAKTARARAYGPYQYADFMDANGFAFIDFASGDADKNGPYLVSNVFGSNVSLDAISGNAGPGAWFTVEFPLNGKRHPNYQSDHFPDSVADGDFYFGLGLGTGDADQSFTYHVKNVVLSDESGAKTVAPTDGDKPAFAGYTDGIAELHRETVSSIIETKDTALLPGGPVSISVDTAKKRQQVRGFGGMSNAWSSPPLTEDDITVMFGNNGLGYSLFRIMIYPDKNKWADSVAIAKKAQSYGAIILASPWTPPAELKSNGSTTGGYLLPEYYAEYAAHLKAFVDYMDAGGVKVDAISFQNEPDINVNYDSCDWSPEQMLNFTRNYGRSIGDVKIIPGESFQFKRSFTDPLLNDTDAVNKFDIIGGHIYDGGLFPYLLAAEKGKEVWMTEHLLNTQGDFPHDITWTAALTAAQEIHKSMLADFNAYMWWYLKRFYSMIGDGEYGSVSGQVTKRGYVMSHYAQYATGKQRIEADISGNENVLVSAYESDYDISLVLINRGKTESQAEINLPAPPTGLSAVETTETATMQDKSVSLDGKTATLILAPESIVSVSFAKYGAAK